MGDCSRERIARTFLRTSRSTSELFCSSSSVAKVCQALTNGSFALDASAVNRVGVSLELERASPRLSSSSLSKALAWLDACSPPSSFLDKPAATHLGPQVPTFQLSRRTRRSGQSERRGSPRSPSPTRLGWRSPGGQPTGSDGEFCIRPLFSSYHHQLLPGFLRRLVASSRCISLGSPHSLSASRRRVQRGCIHLVLFPTTTTCSTLLVSSVKPSEPGECLTFSSTSSSRARRRARTSATSLTDLFLLALQW